MLPVDYELFYPKIEKYIANINYSNSKISLAPNDFLDDFINGIIDQFFIRYKLVPNLKIKTAIHKHCSLQFQFPDGTTLANPFGILYTQSKYQVTIYTNKNKPEITPDIYFFRFKPLYREIYNSEGDHFILFEGKTTVCFEVNLIHLFSNIDSFFFASYEFYKDLLKMRSGKPPNPIYKIIIAMIEARSQMSEASLCKLVNVDDGTWNRWKNRNSFGYELTKKNLTEADRVEARKLLKKNNT